MRIILQRAVEKLGAPGDILEVADGYARNFLIPKGMAAPPSKGAIRHAARLRQSHQKRVKATLDEANATAQRLSAKPVRVAAKAAEGGRLFGSLPAHTLAQEIEKATGVAVDRRHVDLPQPIRSLGTHEVAIHLHPEVIATVTLEVVEK
ncbi:MAG TPA: 50S ribosomal protein L9 [Actinomycetota bacterium]|nr:50S ribosomal protein L9 [Actinomycetota bacterium]